MSTTPHDVDLVVEHAIEAEARGGKHDPRIDRLYRQDVIIIYVFVVVLWLTLWSVFFLVANPEITDEYAALAPDRTRRVRVCVQQRRHDLQHAQAQARGRALLLSGSLLAGREEAAQGRGAPVNRPLPDKEAMDG